MCPCVEEINCLISSIWVVGILMHLLIYASKWLLNIIENVSWNSLEDLLSFRRRKALRVRLS